MERKTRFFGWCPQPTPPLSRIQRFSKPIAAVLTVTVSFIVVAILLTSLFTAQTAAMSLAPPQATPSPSPLPTESEPTATPTPEASVTAEPTAAPESEPEGPLGAGPVQMILEGGKSTYTKAEPVCVEVYIKNSNNHPVYRPEVYNMQITDSSGDVVCYRYWDWNLSAHSFTGTNALSYPSNSTNYLWGVYWNQHKSNFEVYGTGTYNLTLWFTGFMDYPPVTLIFDVVEPETIIYSPDPVLPHYDEMQAYQETTNLTDWTTKIYPEDLIRFTNDTLYADSTVYLYVSDVIVGNRTLYQSPATNTVTKIYVASSAMLEQMMYQLSLNPDLQFNPYPTGPVYGVTVDKAHLSQLGEMPEVYCIRIVPSQDDHPVDPEDIAWELTYDFP